MAVRFTLLFGIIAGSLVSPGAAAPAQGRGSDGAVAATLQIELAPPAASAALRSQVRWTAEADGSRDLAIDLTNASDHDVALDAATVTVPWIPADRPAELIAGGSTSSGVWPPTLIAAPAGKGIGPTSGMYLMAHGAQGDRLAGFLSWRTFWSTLSSRDGALVVAADGEGRRIRAGETVALETVRFSRRGDGPQLLFDYGAAIARSLHLTPKPFHPWAGWSTWDYYGRAWRPDELRGNLAALVRLDRKANLIQIDGGWWSRRGDYGLPRADLGPLGMKELADTVRARGLTMGVHLDGMRAAETSVVAREHPDYFLHDDRGTLLREVNGAGGDGPYVFFDFSNPGACAYLRDAIHRLRADWGYGYFKIDFLRAGIAADLRRRVLDRTPERKLAPFDPGLTSVERFHRALAAFREGMGTDAFFLGCSTPFGPALGHVDALRTGPDIGPRFAAYRSDAEATAGNFYLQPAVAQCDADYLVVRGRPDQDGTLTREKSKDGGGLALNEAELWADYVALTSSARLASDDLMILRPERRQLVERVLAAAPVTRFVPLDFWAHFRARTDPPAVILAETGKGLVLGLFNWTDTPRTFHLAGGGPAEVTLAGRHARVLPLDAGGDFDDLRRKLVVR